MYRQHLLTKTQWADLMDNIRYRWNGRFGIV